MCGRYSQTKIKEKELKARFRLKKLPEQLELQFNIAPTQPVQAILNSSPEGMHLVRWGLIPSWAKEPNTKYSLINARAETIAEKPVYKGLIKNKRCLIIADSFYEWKKVGTKKEPYRIMLKDEGLFAFAGIWDHWERDGNEIISCSIITTSANGLVRDIHDRMPVILPREYERRWLSDIKVEEALALLKPLAGSFLKFYPISTIINSPVYNSAEVIKPL